MPNLIIGTKISGSQKQITSEGKFARKKIIPIAEATFSTELDPHAFKFKFVEYKWSSFKPKIAKDAFEELKILLPQAKKPSPEKHLTIPDGSSSIEPDNDQIKSSLFSIPDSSEEIMEFKNTPPSKEDLEKGYTPPEDQVTEFKSKIINLI